MTILKRKDLRILRSPKNKNTHPKKLPKWKNLKKFKSKSEVEREKEFLIDNNEHGHMLSYWQNQQKSESGWSFKINFNNSIAKWSSCDHLGHDESYRKEKCTVTSTTRPSKVALDYSNSLSTICTKSHGKSWTWVEEEKLN